MGWEREVEELGRRRGLAREMGGAQKLERQRAAGRLDARARVEALCDPGTFREVGELAGFGRYDDSGELTAFTPANFIFGHAALDGRPAVVSADDFTVRGGAADAALHRKMVAAEEMARDYRLPHVKMVEGTGGGGSVRTLETMGHTYIPEVPGWEVMGENLQRQPVVALGLGPVAGLGAGRLVMAHLSVLVEGLSQLFVAGPPVVAAAGEKRTKEELGGAAIHGANGAVDLVVESEAAAFAAARRFLSYLPAHVGEMAPRGPVGDDPRRRDGWLIDAVPRDGRRLYDMRPIVDAVCDRGSVMELGAGWGAGVLTFLARLDGWPVAVLANDPMALGGLWTAAAARKVERFVDLAGLFRLPVVHLVDNPGFMIGRRAEEEGTIRWGSRALMAIAESRVPWVAVMVRKAYGMAGSGHAPPGAYRWRLAWPSGDWGSLPIAGGLEAAYKSELEASADPAAAMAAIAGRLEAVRSPFRTAERFGVEGIIDPRDTRTELCAWVGLARRAAQGVAPGRWRP